MSDQTNMTPKRGRPAKAEEAPAAVTAEVTAVEPTEIVKAGELDERTKLEMAVGRKALENYK